MSPTAPLPGTADARHTYLPAGAEQRANLHNEGHALRNQRARAEQQQAEAALAQKQVQELRQQLKAAEFRATKSDEAAERYRSGRDQAIDDLRALRQQRGHGLGY